MLQQIHQHVVDAAVAAEENGDGGGDGLRREQRVSECDDGGDVQLVDVHGENVGGELDVEIGAVYGAVENGVNNGILPLWRDSEERLGDLADNAVGENGEELLPANDDRIPGEFDQLVEGEVVNDVVIVVDDPFE